MIVKVQMSLSDGGATMLIYNEDRSILYEAKTVPAIAQLLAGRPRAFFHAHLDARRILQIDKAAAEQDW